MTAPPFIDSSKDGDPRDGIVALGGGRRLAYRTYGAPAGRPLIALHGTPGSRLIFSVTHETAVALNLRIIAPDRWAYGNTAPHPSPTLAGFATDIEHLADALQLDQFAIMGVSGGGPYATAVATLLPGRVRGLALVSPVGPMAVTPPPHATAFHRFCFGPLARRPHVVATVFRAFHRLLSWSPGVGMRVGNAMAPPADRRVLGIDEVRNRLARAFIEGLKSGGTGPATDLALFSTAWQIPLQAARMPAKLWLGTADRNVPLSAARALAAALPACELELLPEQGHLWVAVNYAHILQWVANVSDHK